MLILNMNKKMLLTKKLDGVGPVDNRPSTEKLHQFVKKRKKNREKKL